MLIAEFLSQPEIQILLQEENLNQVYEEWCENGNPELLTKFFEEVVGIYPLDYMDTVFRGMYHGLDMKSILIPNNVTSIGFAAFENCSNLKDVTIIGDITHIYPRAFSNCTKLTTINIPKTIK